MARFKTQAKNTNAIGCLKEIAAQKKSDRLPTNGRSFARVISILPLTRP